MTGKPSIVRVFSLINLSLFVGFFVVGMWLFFCWLLLWGVLCVFFFFGLCGWLVLVFWLFFGFCVVVVVDVFV